MPILTHAQLVEKAARLDAQIKILKHLIIKMKAMGKEVNEYLSYIHRCTAELNELGVGLSPKKKVAKWILRLKK